jgi:putative transposase
LVFEDESGFSLVSPLKRTWAPRGHPPIVYTSLAHSVRLNLLGALLVSPAGKKLRLRLNSHARTLRGEEVLAFLAHLLWHVAGPIVLVWDKHPLHQRKTVHDFVARHPRLPVYTLPTGAPELNPTEGIWSQVDEYLAGTAPRTRKELQENIWAGVARTRNSQRRLRACLSGSQLLWKH